MAQELGVEKATYDHTVVHDLLYKALLETCLHNIFENVAFWDYLLADTFS